jgi:hypothetical protein
LEYINESHHGSTGCFVVFTGLNSCTDSDTDPGDSTAKVHPNKHWATTFCVNEKTTQERENNLNGIHDDEKSRLIVAIGNTGRGENAREEIGDGACIISSVWEW